MRQVVLGAGMDSSTHADSDIAAPRRERLSWPVFILLLMLCLIFFITFPDVMADAFCPSDAFSYGTMLSPFVVGGGQTGLIVIWAAIGAWVATAMEPRWREKLLAPVKLLIPVAVAALVVELLIALILSLSYYCVTPSTILLHPYPTAPTRAFTWKDVVTVDVQCIAAAKHVSRGVTSWSPPKANLELSLTDGERVVAQLGIHKSFMAHREPIQAALAGAGYTGRDVADCY